MSGGKAEKEKTKVVFARLPISKYREVVGMAKRETRTEGNMITVLVQEALDARKAKSSEASYRGPS